MLLWLGFIVCTSVIVYSGTKLSKYGDIIAEKTGLGRAWIGLVLMASVTSLKGPLLSIANPNHIISALSAIAMTTIAIVGLTYRAEKKPLLLAWDSIGILLIYLINLMLLYMLR